MDYYIATAIGAFLASAFGYFYVGPLYWRFCAGGAFKRGDFVGAAAAYSKALAISPRDAQLWFLRALALRRVGRVDDALEALFKASELAPNKLEIFNERADIFRSQGRLEDALRDLDWILECDESATEARLTRSSILLDLRRYRDAEADCNRLIEKSDDFSCAGAFNNRGVARLGLERPEEAACDFETAYLLDPRLIVAQAHCAGTWLRRGAPEKTERLCDLALKIDPNCGVAYRYRGLAKRARGDETGALDDLNRADELDA